MFWVVLAILSGGFYALANVLGEHIAEQDLDNKSGLIYLVFVSMVNLPIAILLFFAKSNTIVEALTFEHSSVLSVTALLAAGVLIGISNLLYLKAIKLFDASVISPLYELSFPLTILIGYFVFGDSITAISILGCCLIVLGGLLLTGGVHLSLFNRNVFSTFLYMLLCSLLFDVSTALYKYAASTDTFELTYVINSLGLFLLLGFYCMRSENRKYLLRFSKSPKVSLILVLILMGFASTIASITYYKALVGGIYTYVSFLSSGALYFGSFFFSLVLAKFAFSKITALSFYEKLTRLGSIAVILSGSFLIYMSIN